ncbi:MAG: hypothetical protein CMQ38_12795 [Gammaproteobacteria bacterium]|nr:hypothetical protein [Gammaproteobacteria bacterium]
MTRKTIQQEKLSQAELFEAVVLNAIDFIYCSFDNLEKRPKNSIVEFYTAIELFLKAKLMEEHWALILSKPENADIDKFQQGDFYSVNLEECVKRLRNISKAEIPDEAVNNFKTLKEHRNQIVHFAHSDYSDKEKGRAMVVIEQFKSWYHLHTLLTSTWYTTFGKYERRIERIHDQVSKNKRFLSVRFEALQGEIADLKQRGLAFVKCTYCECESGLVSAEHLWGSDFDCIVCGKKDVAVKETNETIPCPHCGDEYQFFNKNIEICPNCNKAVSTEEKISTCKNKFTEGDEWCDEDTPIPASCGWCDNHPNSVFLIDGLWSCVACFERGWQAMSCPHCGEFVTGDMNTLKYCWCHKCEPDTSEAFGR